MHWLTHRDGPARALSAVPGVRARYPQVLGVDGQVVWATDADGADAVEVGSGDPAAPPRRLAAGQVGRISGLAAAPDGTAVAVAAQDGRLRLVDAASGQVRELTASANGRVTGLAWSPDSAWLAWSEPTEHPGGMRRPAAAQAPPSEDRRRPGQRRHRRALHRYRASIHWRRQVPGLPVPAQFRPHLRRAFLRPVVSVRRPALPAAAVGVDTVALCSAAGRPAYRRRPRTARARTARARTAPASDGDRRRR